MISYYQWKQLTEVAGGVAETEQQITDQDNDEIVIQKINGRVRMWLNRLLQELDKRSTSWRRNPRIRLAILEPIASSLGINPVELSRYAGKMRADLNPNNENPMNINYNPRG